jgi:hypothetical protein
MTPSEKRVLLVHSVFAGLAAATLLSPVGPSAGTRVLFLVLAYNIGMIALGTLWKHSRWLDIFAFALPLSILQVLPDWFLSGKAGTLVFPDDGSPRIGTVPVFMAGLWTLPVFLSIFIAVRARKRWPALSRMMASLLGGLAAFVIYVLSEITLTRIPLWTAQNTTVVWGAALYVLPAEFILAVFAVHSYFLSETQPWLFRWFYAGTTMLVYAGALAISLLFLG